MQRAKAQDRGLVKQGARLIILASGLALWELLSVTFEADFWVSKPSKVAVRLYEVTASSDIFRHLAVTLYEAFGGLLLGAVIGILAGFGLGRTKTLSDVLQPYILAFNSLPRVALAPLFVLWLGIGLEAKLLTAFSIVVFVFLVNTFAGTRNVDPDLIMTARLFGANDRQLVTKVIIPWCVPWIFAALRLSVGFALIGAVVGEFMGANVGLGYYIDHASAYFDAAGIFAGIVILMVVALILVQGLVYMESKLLKWRPESVA